MNGAFCTVRQWDRVVPDLARECRVIRHDIRGAGESAPGSHDERYRFATYVADILEIKASLGIRALLESRSVVRRGDMQ